MVSGKRGRLRIAAFSRKGKKNTFTQSLATAQERQSSGRPERKKLIILRVQRKPLFPFPGEVATEGKRSGRHCSRARKKGANEINSREVLLIVQMKSVFKRKGKDSLYRLAEKKKPITGEKRSEASVSGRKKKKHEKSLCTCRGGEL